MTSVVDKYYRKISENVDNLKMKFDNSALLVKSKEHDSKIDTNVSDISDNLSKIETNKSNISDNLGKIDTNVSDISDNLSKIETNKSNISDNLGKIDTHQTTLSNIDNDLVNLRGRINTHQTDIQNINTNINDNTSLINTNKNSINDLINGYKLKDILIFNITDTKSQAVNKNKKVFTIFTGNINDTIKKDSYLQFECQVLLRFLLHYVNISFFYCLLTLFDSQNNLITSIKMSLIGTISKQGIISNTCYLKIPNDYKNIKFELSIRLQDNQNRNDIVKVTDFNNFIYCKIFEKLDSEIVFDV